jgi:hypothetical protein
LKIGEEVKNFGLLLSTVKSTYILILILTKTGLAYVLGDYFPNSSGHPESESRAMLS